MAWKRKCYLLSNPHCVRVLFKLKSAWLPNYSLIYCQCEKNMKKKRISITSTSSKSFKVSCRVKNVIRCSSLLVWCYSRKTWCGRNVTIQIIHIVLELHRIWSVNVNPSFDWVFLTRASYEKKQTRSTMLRFKLYHCHVFEVFFTLNSKCDPDYRVCRKCSI